MSASITIGYELAKAGHTTYNFSQSIRDGDTIGAVTAGLSLASTAYGFVADDAGEPTQKVVSGQPKEDSRFSISGASNIAGSQAAIPAGVGAGAAAAARVLLKAAKWIWEGVKWVGSKAADATRQAWAKGKAQATGLLLRYAPWLLPASQLARLRPAQYEQIWGKNLPGARVALDAIRRGVFTKPDGITMRKMRVALEWYRCRLVAKPDAVSPGIASDLREQFIRRFQENRY